MRKILKCANTDNQKIAVFDVPSPFDLQDLVEIDNGYYCLANNNAIEATNDFIQLNSFLNDAYEICPEFPVAEFPIADINFNYNPNATPRNYPVLKIAPLTPTGKPPKYPLCLIYRGTKVYYGRDKKIQKARIIVWKGSICYELDLAINKKELAIHSIYRTSLSDSIKRKIYGASDKE